MRKKILTLILILVSSFMLVACFLDDLVDKTVYTDYVSESVYEQQIIDTVEQLKYTTVSLKSSDEKASAVIIAKKSGLLNNEYLAATTLQIANDISKYTIISPKSKKNIQVLKTLTNETYSFGFITFNSSEDLGVANFRNDKNELYPLTIGQNIIASSTNGIYEPTNSAKLGTISQQNIRFNGINNYMFMHSASINSGEEGSGVFDIYGNLIGINTKITRIETTEGSKNIFGENYAITLEALAASIDKIDFTKSGNFNIDPNDLLEVSYTTPQLTQIESASKNIFSENIDSVVNIIVSGNIYSGIIYKKELNVYYVLTKYFEELDAEVFINSNAFEAIKNPLITSRDFSVFMFTSLEDLSIYNSQVINTNVGIKNVSGQKALTISANEAGVYHHLDVSTLSLPNYNNTGQLMIDGKLNRQEQGAPVFNLKGELLGINSARIDEVGIDVYGEGLNYVIDINKIAQTLNMSEITTFNKYESTFVEEENIINTYLNVKDVVVTVITDFGHGSGTIYKKETTANGFLYYVLTNHHVINEVSEASIFHNESGISYIARDYQASAIHDVAVVRFETTDELSIANAPVLNSDIRHGFLPGQTLIAVGSPEDTLKYGYITTGILGTEPVRYNLSPRLGLVSDTALNPGNSGGPVFNLKGEFVGINVSKITQIPVGQYYTLAERISSSLNINIVVQVIAKFANSDYITYGERAPKLGVSVAAVEDFVLENPSYAQLVPRTTNGIIVLGIDQTRDSYKKLQEFDLIFAINGKAVSKIEQVASMLADGKFGDEFSIDFLRLDELGNVQTLNVIVKLS